MSSSTMGETAHGLEILRPLGKLEQIASSCHHIGFFNNVGLSAWYNLADSASPPVFDLRSLIYTAVRDVVRKHRILSAIPVNEDTPNPHFAALPSVDLDRCITFLQRSKDLDTTGGEDKKLDSILEDQHNTDFKCDYGTLPFWRLIILQSPGKDNEFTASFVYHHGIGDGVAGLGFHDAFRQALDTASSSPSKVGTIITPDEPSPLLHPLEELHDLPINPTPPQPPTANLAEWTGNPIHIPCKSRWATFYVSSNATRGFLRQCKENRQSVTSVLSSVIATVSFARLPSTVEALTCIIPVNLRPWLKIPHNAPGTYFDATRTQFTRDAQTSQDPSSVDVWSGARKASAAIKNYLSNVSPSGEPYTSVAIFKSIPDVAVVLESQIGRPRDAAFEVTNVGLVSSSTPPTTEEGACMWQVDTVLLSRSAGAAGAAFTVSAATGKNGIMALGFSWQEGVVEDSFVDSVRQGVKKFFDKYE
ncbi:hypothetical protein BJX76DRAFT_366222 [Aspergillus varians]